MNESKSFEKSTHFHFDAADGDSFPPCALLVRAAGGRDAMGRSIHLSEATDSTLDSLDRLNRLKRRGLRKTELRGDERL